MPYPPPPPPAFAYSPYGATYPAAMPPMPVPSGLSPNHVLLRVILNQPTKSHFWFVCYRSLTMLMTLNKLLPLLYQVMVRRHHRLRHLRKSDLLCVVFFCVCVCFISIFFYISISILFYDIILMSVLCPFVIFNSLDALHMIDENEHSHQNDANRQ